MAVGQVDDRQPPVGEMDRHAVVLDREQTLVIRAAVGLGVAHLPDGSGAIHLLVRAGNAAHGSEPPRCRETPGEPLGASTTGPSRPPESIARSSSIAAYRGSHLHRSAGWAIVIPQGCGSFTRRAWRVGHHLPGTSLRSIDPSYHGHPLGAPIPAGSRSGKPSQGREEGCTGQSLAAFSVGYKPMNSSVAELRPRERVLVPTSAQASGRSVRRRVGLVWGLLVLNALTYYGSALHIPHAAGRVITQAALPAALIVALSVNRRVVVRPNVFLCLVSLLVVEAIITCLQPEHLGTLYRTFRLGEFVAVLWLLTPWWGRRDL